jgi:hypothetical protein
MFDFTSGRQSTKACIVLTDGVSSDRVEDPGEFSVPMAFVNIPFYFHSQSIAPIGSEYGGHWSWPRL